MSYDIAYMWNIKMGTNELTYETEIALEIQKINLWLLGVKGWGRMNSKTGIDAHTI